MIDQDTELLTLIAQGDQAAIHKIVTQKLPRLLALSTRMLGNRAEAEEVVQEAFVRLWKQAGTWKSGEAKLDTWLHRVTMNLCYDRLRANKNNCEMADDTIFQASIQYVDERPNPELTLNQKQQGELVSIALKKLPTRQKEALILKYYQSLSNTDAAYVMRINIDALESLLARSRRNMKVLLQQHNFIEK